MSERAFDDRSSPTKPEQSLPQFLAARARSASDGRLTLDGVGGLLLVGVALTWRPRGWFLLLNGALCFAAFGVWGIADRELAERGTSSGAFLRRSLMTLRVLAGAVGAVSVIALLLGATAFALGTWIS